MIDLALEGGFLCYLAAHLGLYLVVLRHQEFFTHERPIFSYHLFSAIGVGVVMLVAAFTMTRADNGWQWLSPTVLVIALHGIYSLSFLELWSLAEGAYSLSLLEDVKRGGCVPGHELRSRLATIGASKQQARIKALKQLTFIESVGSGLKLTARGRLVALILALVARSANLKELG